MSNDKLRDALTKPDDEMTEDDWATIFEAIKPKESDNE